MILAAQIYQVPRLRKVSLYFWSQYMPSRRGQGQVYLQFLSANLYEVSNGFERLWTEPAVF